MPKSNATAKIEAPKAPQPKKAAAPVKGAAEKPAQPKAAVAPPKPATAAPPTPAAVRPIPAAPAFQKKPMRPPITLVPPRLAEVAAPVAEVDYAEGDYVVYPTHGVGRVTGIEQQVISGHKLRLIAIKFEKDRMTLRVPVAKAQESGLRKLSTRKVMDSALAALKGKVRIKRTMWSRRAQEYEAKINSGDPVSIAEVVRDLHRGSDQPDQSYSERQMYQAALDRLAREFAAVEKIDEATAAERLEELLKAA
jgi:CarD family transcriptional regulator